jgi:hypothetical protein
VGAATAAVGVVVIAVALVTKPPHLARFETTATEAMNSARDHLDGAGFDLTGYRSMVAAVQDLGGRGEDAPQASDLNDGHIVPTYLAHHGGNDALDRVYPNHRSPVEWRARFFKPLEQREYNVHVDARTLVVSGLAFVLPDSAALPSLDQDVALSLAQRFLAQHGRGLDGFEVVDSRTEERENRADHFFKFQSEAAVPDAGDARLVYKVTIHGDHVGAYRTEVKIPEEWSREYRKDTVMESVGGAAFIVLFVGLIAAFVVTTVRVMRTSQLRWRTALLGAAGMTVLAVVGSLNEWPTAYLDYETSVPVRSFLGGELTQYFVRSSALFGMYLLLWLSATMMNPDAFDAFRGAKRRVLGKDALLSAGLTLGAICVLTGLEMLIEAAVPSLNDWSRFGASDVGVWSPALGLVAKACLETMTLFLIAVIAWHMWGRYLNTRRRKVTVLTAVVLLMLLGVVGESSGVGELAGEVILIGLAIPGILLLWRFYWRDNPVALLAGIFVIVASEEVYELWLRAPAYRTDAWIALVVLALPLVFLAFESRGARRKTATGRV